MFLNSSKSSKGSKCLFLFKVLFLYGLGKVHNETNNGLPPFHSILSAIGTPTYKLAKFLLPFLTPLTQNEYTITDAFHFAEEICKQDPIYIWLV